MSSTQGWRRRTAWVAVALLVWVATTGCGSSGDAADGGSSILVFAAASLRTAFDQIGPAFEQAHPGTNVRVTTAGSASLREQILDGAPVDVFAPADPSHLEALQEAGLVDGPGPVIARNRLTLAVPAGNPGGVTGLDDLARSELLVGLCAEGVPCGDLARRALAAAGVTPAVDTDETDVRSLLAKLEAGELDVGLVYRTDVVAAAGSVERIDLPPGDELDEVIATYRIAALADAPHGEEAAAFVAFVQGPEAQAILAEQGFDAP